MFATLPWYLHKEWLWQQQIGAVKEWELGEAQVNNLWTIFLAIYLEIRSHHKYLELARNFWTCKLFLSGPVNVAAFSSFGLWVYFWHWMKDIFSPLLQSHCHHTRFHSHDGKYLGSEHFSFVFPVHYCIETWCFHSRFYCIASHAGLKEMKSSPHILMKYHQVVRQLYCCLVHRNFLSDAGYHFSLECWKLYLELSWF